MFTVKFNLLACLQWLNENDNDGNFKSFDQMKEQDEKSDSAHSARMYPLGTLNMSLGRLEN